MQDIRFDDIDALRAKVSEHVRRRGAPEVEVTQDMINKFAELTGDHQWIHVDVERAKRESPFKGTIAHGFLTLSLLPALRAGSDHKIVGYGNATNYGSDKLRFVSPVPAGAKVHARARLVARRGEAEGHPGHAGDRRARGRQRRSPGAAPTRCWCCTTRR